MTDEQPHSGDPELRPMEQSDLEVGLALVLRVPETARIPDGATFYDGEDDGHCRLVRSDGSRCAAIRNKATGLCNGHAGTSPLARDPKAYSRLAHAEKAKRSEHRALLGIGAKRIGSARQQARIKALARADEIAAAMVDGPLDDSDLGSIQRQLAVIRMLDSVEPIQTVSLTVEAPRTADEVSGMGWQEMQALAAQLLDQPAA